MPVTILRKVTVSGGTVLRAANNLGDVADAATSWNNLAGGNRTITGNLTVSGTGTSTFAGKIGISGNGAVPTASALEIGTNGAATRFLYNVPTGGEHNFSINGTSLGGFSPSGFFTNASVNATLGGNLTVSGTGTSSFAGSAKVGASSTADSKLHVYESAAAGTGNGITVEQAGAGDAVIQFLLTGTQRWSAGVDNSDSDAFVLSAGALGSSNRLRVATNGDTSITSTTASTSTTTGALQVAGGVGVAGSVFTGGAFASDTNISWSTLSATGARMIAQTAWGAVIGGYGATNDVSLFNRAGGLALSVPGNTTNVTVAGNLTVSGTGTSTIAGTLQFGSNGTSSVTRTTMNGAGAHSVFSVASDARTVNDAPILNIDARDSANNVETYVQLKAKITDATAGSEGADFLIATIAGGTRADRVTINSTGTTLAGTITTSAPTGGSGAWKLGVANSVSPTSPNRTITIEIGGTVYYLHAKTTND